MTILQIPTDTVRPFWDQNCTLDGSDYILAFRYNQREACYYMIIAQSDETIVCGGVKIVSNWLLLQDLIDTRLPPGEFLAQTTGSNDASPALGELGIGQRVTLYYIPRADMQAAGLDPNRDPLALLPS